MPKVVRKLQKANAAAQARVLPKIPPELLDGLVKGQLSFDRDDNDSTDSGLTLANRQPQPQYEFAHRLSI